jgi:hypothetical protein
MLTCLPFVVPAAYDKLHTRRRLWPLPQTGSAADLPGSGLERIIRTHLRIILTLANFFREQAWQGSVVQATGGGGVLFSNTPPSRRGRDLFTVAVQRHARLPPVAVAIRRRQSSRKRCPHTVSCRFRWVRLVRRTLTKHAAPAPVLSTKPRGHFTATTMENKCRVLSSSRSATPSFFLGD